MAKQPIPTMLIGLGGSGAWSLIHAKQALLDTYGNILPDNVEIVVLDTLDSIDDVVAQVGSSDILRGEGEGIGGVRFTPGEYAHLGGDAYQFGQDIAYTDQYPHIRSWFQAEWKRKNLKRGQWNLNEGAGMFRQMGRLALFYDLLNANTSAAKLRIEDKLKSIERGQGSVSVMIVGSLVGGTGAGLFLDIAHLVRQVAKVNNIEIVIRGFFFLPQAFNRDLNAANLQSARQRSYAAIRELERLILHEEAKFGIQMHYVNEIAGMEQRIYRGELVDKLYDFIYLIDGNGNRSKMNQYPLKIAAAPVVAEAMSAFMDSQFGNIQMQVINNLNAAVTNRQLQTGKQAYIGSVGSYSILLPIQNLIEGWSYRLSLEALKSLVPASETTAHHDHIIDIRHDANAEMPNVKPEKEVENVLTTEMGIPDPTDPDGRRAYVPTPLWRQALETHKERLYSRDSAIDDMSIKDINGWLKIIRPSSQDADEIIQRILDETNDTIEVTAASRIKTSDESGSDPTIAHRNIKDKAEDFIRDQLGRVEQGGRRGGGEYGRALKRLAEAQALHFRNAMAAYITNTLNGSSRDDADAALAKGGKLGWIIAVFKEMRRVFDAMQDITLAASQNATITQEQHQSMSDSLDTAATIMAEESKRSRRIPFTTHPAVVAQRDYLQTVQEYVNFQRKLMLQDYVRNAANRIIEIIDQIQEELAAWKQVLATHDNSLHNTLISNERRIKNEKVRANDVRNRWVINDPKWEDEQYNILVKRHSAKQAILKNWQWQSTVQEVSGELRISIGAKLNNQTVHRDMRGVWHEGNRKTVIGYAREVFQGAVRDLNVVNYLMSSSTANGPDDKPVSFVEEPAALGDFLFERCGPQLAINAGAEEVLTNTLLAVVDTTTTDNNPSRMHPQNFLNNALKRLIQRQGGGGDGENAGNNLIQCDDPFRLTLISTAEVVPINSVQAYGANQSDYMKLAKDARKITHILPPEVTAVDYEERLNDLPGQSRRDLKPFMIDIFEDERRLRQFMYLVAYKIIRRFEIEQGGEQNSFWGLEVPGKSIGRREGELEIIWLTEPSRDPFFLETARTYVLRKKDIRAFRDQNKYENDIPSYKEVAEHLYTVRRAEAEFRAESGDLAFDIRKLREGYDEVNDHPFEPEMRQWIEVFMPPIATFQNEETGEEFDAFDFNALSQTDLADFLRVAEMVVQHDVLNELRHDLQADLPRRNAKIEQVKAKYGTALGHEDVMRAESEYDFFSVAVLILNDEIQALRTKIRGEYNNRSGITDWGITKV